MNFSKTNIDIYFDYAFSHLETKPKKFEKLNRKTISTEKVLNLIFIMIYTKKVLKWGNLLYENMNYTKSIIRDTNMSSLPKSSTQM